MLNIYLFIFDYITQQDYNQDTSGRNPQIVQMRITAPFQTSSN